MVELAQQLLALPLVDLLSLSPSLVTSPSGVPWWLGQAQVQIPCHTKI